MECGSKQLAPKKEPAKPVVKKEAAPPVVKKEVAEPAKVEEPPEMEECECPDCENPLTIFQNQDQLIQEGEMYEDGYDCGECGEESPTWPMWHCKRGNCNADFCTECVPLPDGYVVPEAPAKKKEEAPKQLDKPSKSPEPKQPEPAVEPPKIVEPKKESPKVKVPPVNIEKAESKKVEKKEEPKEEKKPAKVEEKASPEAGEAEPQICPDCDSNLRLIKDHDALMAIQPDIYEDGYECGECDETDPTWPMWHCMKENCMYDVCLNCRPDPNALPPLAKEPEKIKVRPSIHRRFSDDIGETEAGKESPRPDAGSGEGGIFSPRPGTQAKTPDYGSAVHEEEVEAEDILTPPPLLQQSSRLDEEEQEKWEDLKEGEIGDKVN